MIRNRSFSIVAILVAGLILAVLLVPGGAFAQDGGTNGGSNGQSGAAAIGNMIMQGWNHSQMHANAGQMGGAMMGTGHMGNQTNMSGMMNGSMTGSMATMHAGMMGRGMGAGMGSMMGGGMGAGMGGMMGNDAEHQRHMAGMMAGTDECPLNGDNTAEHPAQCPYQSDTTTGD